MILRNPQFSGTGFCVRRNYMAIRRREFLNYDGESYVEISYSNQ